MNLTGKILRLSAALHPEILARVLTKFMGEAHADITALYAAVSTALHIQDEGTPKGDVGTINFVGAGVSAVVAGSTATVTIPGGSSGGTVSVGTYASRPAAGTAGNMYIATDAPVAQWIDDGSAWRPMLLGQIPALQPPAAASFTAFNQGASTLTDRNGALRYLGVNDGGVTFQLRGYTEANTATTAYVEAAASNNTALASGSSTIFAIVGVGIRQSSTAQAYLFQVQSDNGAADDLQLVVSWWSNNTTRTTFSIRQPPGSNNAPIFIRTRRDATNLFAETSTDRQNWIQHDTRTVASVFSGATNQVGIIGFGINIVPDVNILHYKSGS